MPDWHGTKGMWIDRILDPHCDFEVWPDAWPWPLIFKDKFWKSRNSGMGCPIHVERNGCESTECRTHVMAFNFISLMNLTLNFQCEILKYLYPKKVTGDWHGTKGIRVDKVLSLLCDLELWPWPWIFKVKLWKCCISGMGGPFDMEPKGCESIGCSWC